jgi:hypothetical protein
LRPSFNLENALLHLPLLATFAAGREFGTAATAFLLHGAKPASLRRVASSLGVEAEAVEAAVAATARVMIESARLKLHERDFVASVREAGLGAATAAALHDAFEGARMELEDASSRSSSALPTLQGLEWRLEVEVASRTRRATLPSTAAVAGSGAGAESGRAGAMAESATTTAVLESAVAKPSFLLRLDTVAAASGASSAPAGASGIADQQVNSQYASCDYATLALMKARLEAALAELSSAHAKRIQRYLR